MTFLIVGKMPENLRSGLLIFWPQSGPLSPLMPEADDCLAYE
jgi:hypothetical protein